MPQRRLPLDDQHGVYALKIEHGSILSAFTSVDGRKRAWCERARFLTCVPYRRRRAWCEWALTDEWAERAALPSTAPRSHGFRRDMHRFVKDQLFTAVDKEEGQMSSDRSVDYVSDRRLKLRKGHERKMHAERCFASQKVSSAADFQRDETVNANERVDKTGADDSAGRRPTVRSKQHAVRAQRRCVAPVSVSSSTAKIDTFSETETDDFEMKDDNDADVIKSGGCSGKRSGKTVAAVKQASDSAQELNVQPRATPSTTPSAVPAGRPRRSGRADGAVPTTSDAAETPSRRRRSSRRRSDSFSYDSDSGDEHHSTERAKRRWIRPPTFDGSTQSFATFRAQFDNAAAFNRWSENVQLAHLKSRLVSVAAQSLWDTPKDQTDTLDKLWKLLEARYGSRNVMERYRTELRARRRRAGETLNDLFVDVKRLVALGYQAEAASSSVLDSIAKDCFIDALDTDLALRVREKEPSTLDNALHVALRLEAIHGATSSIPPDDVHRGRG